MENLIKKFDFELTCYVLHSAHFCRGFYKKDGKLISCGSKEFNSKENSIYNFNRKLDEVNEAFDAIINYLKDVFLIISYIKRKFASIKKDIEYDKEKAKEVEKLADYLDEILNRNICNFIRGYYLFEKKNSIKYYHWKYENICYHNPHEKYFGYNAFDFLEKYLKENIYEKLNIFGYRIYESLDGFYNFNIDDFTKKVIEKEEEFLKWM